MMTEMTKADVFLAYLDRILAGYDIGLFEDTEITKLLLLAKTMIAADFSVNTEIREALRKKLLEQISLEDKYIPAVMFKDKRQAEDELTEEDLTYVAAGWAGQAGEETCPFCGAKIKTLQGKCSLCHQ